MLKKRERPKQMLLNSYNNKTKIPKAYFMYSGPKLSLQESLVAGCASNVQQPHDAVANCLKCATQYKGLKNYHYHFGGSLL